jgi:hypothetical protein
VSDSSLLPILLLKSSSDLQYEAQLKNRLADLDDHSKAWVQALAMAPRLLPNSHAQFAAAEEEGKEIANNVLTLPTANVDEALARMDHTMGILAERLARLRRVVYHDPTDTAPPSLEVAHVGVVEEDEFASNDEDDVDVDVDVDEKLTVDILVADILHEKKEQELSEDEQDFDDMY